MIEKVVRNDRNLTLDDVDVEDLRAVLAESVAGLGTTYPDVHVTLALKHGLVDEALASSDEPWDLIVVGRHPMTTVTRVFTGSIARRCWNVLSHRSPSSPKGQQTLTEAHPRSRAFGVPERTIMTAVRHRGQR